VACPRSLFQLQTDLRDDSLRFDCRCRRLPKAMREWPAYIDLKKKIDDFNEMCPLLELMADKAMKDRHWQRLSELCQYTFDVESETFTLASVLHAPLLEFKDDVEVCSHFAFNYNYMSIQTRNFCIRMHNASLCTATRIN